MFVIFFCFIGARWIILIINIDVIVEWVVYRYNSAIVEIFVLVDWISCLFIRVVLIISSIVIWYRVSYMGQDKSIIRFMILVVLFVSSMVLMILIPSLFRVLFGWDILGLVSYCLVIYYQRRRSYDSGIVTVLSNRIGDVGLLMAIGISLIYGRWNIYILKFNGQGILLIMVLLAAITKRAQMPFSSWLPMAIAAPTPVSALVHSSTLVTAGVYLIIRYNRFIIIRGLNEFLLVISVSTILISGLMANFEYDLKKIIALSTLRQLGLMMSVLGLGGDLLGFYHLLTHAVFKSLLFISAGAIIHSRGDNQDIRYYGNLKDFIPFVIIRFYVSTLALMGYPFLSGFYSKDLIIEVSYISDIGFILISIMLVSLSLTVVYSLRLCIFVYYGPLVQRPLNFSSEDKLINISMFFLIFLRVRVGSMLNWIFFFDCEVPYLSWGVKMLTIIFFVGGILFGLIWVYIVKDNISVRSLKYKGFLKFNFSFLSSMWLLNYLHIMMVRDLTKISSWAYTLDSYWVEFIEGGSWFNLKLTLKEIYYRQFKIYKVVSLHMILLVLFIYLIL